MNIAVLGAGPAGLLAALAVRQAHHEPVIITRPDLRAHPAEPQRSPILGLQYLHSPIPGLTDRKDQRIISVFKRCNREGYAQKVYGSPAAACSWDTIAEGEHVVWDLRDLYERLWVTFEHCMIPKKLDEDDISELCQEYSLVLSSVPAIKFCRGGHVFDLRPVRISQQRSEDRQGLVVYNGCSTDPWYRYSQVFGIDSWEYPDSAELPRPGFLRRRIYTKRIEKPLKTDCDCHLENSNFVRIGRYGAWQKNLLLHDAYWAAREAVLKHVV